MCWMIGYFEKKAESLSENTATQDGSTCTTALSAHVVLGCEAEINAPPSGARDLFLIPRNMKGQTVFDISPERRETCCCDFFHTPDLYAEEGDPVDPEEVESEAMATALQKRLRAYIADRLAIPCVQPYLFVSWGERMTDFSLPAAPKPLPFADLETIFCDYEPQGLYRLDR